MPSIAEIIAARIAAKQANPAADTTPRESMTEKLELDALDTRLAPVKPAVAAAARKVTGIVLSRDLPASSPNGEARGQATPIRTLGEPVTAPQPLSIAEAWGATLGCTEQDLCLLRDPTDPETCWLAVRHQECIHPPILIMRLPWMLWEPPMTDEDIPF